MKRIFTRLWAIGLCLCLVASVPALAQEEQTVTISAQTNTLEPGEAGEIVFDVQLSGFGDYGMKGSVLWLEADGETKADKPRGVHVKGLDGSPTDKTLTFTVRDYAMPGTYYFRLKVDGVLGDALCAISVFEHEPAVMGAADGAAALEVRTIFDGSALEGVTVEATLIEDAQRLEDACAQAGVQASDAALYQISASDGAGQSLDVLPEKVYAYLSIDGATQADAYALIGESARHTGARVQENGVRIAVKEMGEYLIILA